MPRAGRDSALRSGRPGPQDQRRSLPPVGDLWQRFDQNGAVEWGEGGLLTGVLPPTVRKSCSPTYRVNRPAPRRVPQLIFRHAGLLTLDARANQSESGVTAMHVALTGLADFGLVTSAGPADGKASMALCRAVGTVAVICAGRRSSKCVREIH